MQTNVEEIKLIGVNGEEFILAGPEAGDKGVWLGTGIEGSFYDPDVKVVYEEPANLPGARYLSHRLLRRDIVFGVEILNDPGTGNSWLSRDSAWRKAFRYHRDCQLIVTTDESGPRTLNMKLGAQPQISMHTDPTGKSVNRAVMTCYAGDVFWYGEDDVYTVTTTTNTTGGGVENLTLDITDPINPTDQYVFPVWVGTAPAKWTIPDYSWEDDDQADRRIIMPELLSGEDITIHVDPRYPHVVADNLANVQGRMNGIRFRHPIPEYTGPGTFNISVTKAPIGAQLQLRLMRPWSRPWGLE
jgi:hypothetical protein